MRIFVTHICPKNKILEYGVSISASNFNYNLIDGGVFDKVYSVYPGFVRRRLNEGMQNISSQRHSRLRRGGIAPGS